MGKGMRGGDCGERDKGRGLSHCGERDEERGLREKGWGGGDVRKGWGERAVEEMNEGRGLCEEG